ncbi:hypothetical protein GLYMA_03G263550v4 [Glycine max]|nr:hypothetical protein GLYMA_03G263550v4 [Glycine max]KAH1071966.1 hypothetical protein GYH30_008441 [Glycine max]
MRKQGRTWIVLCPSTCYNFKGEGEKINSLLTSHFESVLLSHNDLECVLTLSRIVVHPLTLSLVVVHALTLSLSGLRSHSHDAFISCILFSFVCVCYLIMLILYINNNNTPFTSAWIEFIRY